MTTIELFIANALLIQGIHFAAYNIFGKASGWYAMAVNNSSLEWTMKPLFSCRPCMSSIWGIAGFYLTNYEWYWYPIWAICLAGAGVVLKFGK